MNRSKIGLILAGFMLAAGMGSASVLDNFGAISGEASVEGPTFVAASDGALIPERKFEDDGFPYAELDKTTLDYYNDESLPSSDWYPLNLTYYLDAEINSEDSPSPVEVEMTLRGKKNGNSYRVCTGTLEVSSREGKEVVQDSCTGSFSHEVEELEMELNVITDNGDIQYSGTGDTKVEVSAQ